MAALNTNDVIHYHEYYTASKAAVLFAMADWRNRDGVMKVWQSTTQQDKGGIDFFALTKKGVISVQVKANWWGTEIVILEDMSQEFYLKQGDEFVRDEATDTIYGLLRDDPDNPSCDVVCLVDLPNKRMLELDWNKHTIDMFQLWADTASENSRTVKKRRNSDKQGMNKGDHGHYWDSSFVMFNVTNFPDFVFLNGKNPFSD